MSLDIRHQILRIFIALIVGCIIGFERKKSNKAAGIKTHSIITIISTMLTIVSLYGFSEFQGISLDPTRLISNIITGVGFLCSGVIFVKTKKNNDESVVGLTTAAGIFGSAMLGIPIGMGHYPLVIMTVVGIEICLFVERISRMFGLTGSKENKKQSSHKQLINKEERK